MFYSPSVPMDPAQLAQFLPSPPPLRTQSPPSMDVASSPPPCKPGRTPTRDSTYDWEEDETLPRLRYDDPPRTPTPIPPSLPPALTPPVQAPKYTPPYQTVHAPTPHPTPNGVLDLLKSDCRASQGITHTPQPSVPPPLPPRSPQRPSPSPVQPPPSGLAPRTTPSITRDGRPCECTCHRPIHETIHKHYPYHAEEYRAYQQRVNARDCQHDHGHQHVETFHDREHCPDPYCYHCHAPSQVVESPTEQQHIHYNYPHHEPRDSVAQSLDSVYSSQHSSSLDSYISSDGGYFDVFNGYRIDAIRGFDGHTASVVEFEDQLLSAWDALQRIQVSGDQDVGLMWSRTSNGGQVAEVPSATAPEEMQRLAAHLFLHQPRMSLDGTEVLASPYDRLAEAKRTNPIPELSFTAPLTNEDIGPMGETPPSLGDRTGSPVPRTSSPLGHSGSPKPEIVRDSSPAPFALSIGLHGPNGSVVAVLVPQNTE